MDYRIITDANTDLTPALVQELDIDVIPMEFIICGKSLMNYPDGREMDAHSFYELVRGGETCTTALVNTARFVDIFEPYLKEGKDLLFLCFSSGLSGTYNNAMIAAQELREIYPDRKLLVTDTRAASMGEGLLVYHAALKKRDGLSIEELDRWVEEKRDHICHWFTVDDLNHLKRGGRVSPAAALFGTMLGIKPVLHVDDEGHLIPVEKVRGRKASLDALVKHMEATVENPGSQIIFISHGDCPEDADYIANLVREKFQPKEIVISTIGPVIGAHAGPGTVALFYVGKHKN